MACNVVTMPNGGRAFVCGPAKRCKCGRRATLLCDWKVPAKSSGTCDARLCLAVHIQASHGQGPLPTPRGRMEGAPETEKGSRTEVTRARFIRPGQD